MLFAVLLQQSFDITSRGNKPFLYAEQLVYLYFSELSFCKLPEWQQTTIYMGSMCVKKSPLKGVLHPWTLFLKTLCIFSKNKATSDKVSYGSGQKCSKELKNHSFTSVETIVVKLQWKMCENQYFPCFEP